MSGIKKECVSNNDFSLVISHLNLNSGYLVPITMRNPAVLVSFFLSVFVKFDSVKL